jgi:hypothetical protein
LLLQCWYQLIKEICFEDRCDTKHCTLSPVLPAIQQSPRNNNSQQIAKRGGLRL